MARNATYQQIADALGLGHRERVGEYKKKGMPVTSIDAARAWFTANVRGDDGGEEAGGGSYQRKMAAEARVKEADAARKELELRQLRAELVSREEVLRTNEKIVAEIRARLEQLPDEIAGTLPPDIRAGIANDMRESISLALMRLSEIEELK